MAEAMLNKTQKLVENASALLTEVDAFLKLAPSNRAKGAADDFLQRIAKMEIKLTNNKAWTDNLRLRFETAKAELNRILEVEVRKEPSVGARSVADLTPLRTGVTVSPPTSNRGRSTTDTDVNFTSVDAPPVLMDKVGRDRAEKLFDDYGQVKNGGMPWSQLWDNFGKGLSSDQQKNFWLGPNASSSDWNTFSGYMKNGDVEAAQKYAQEHGLGGAALTLLALKMTSTTTTSTKIDKVFDLNIQLGTSVWESEEAFRQNFSFARAKIGLDSHLIWVKGGQTKTTYTMDSGILSKKEETSPYSNRYSYHGFEAETAVNMFFQTFKPAAHFYVTEDRQLYFGGWSLTMGDPKNPMLGHWQEIKFAREKALNLGAYSLEPGQYVNKISSTIAFAFDSHHALVLIPSLDIADNVRTTGRAGLGGSGVAAYKLTEGKFIMELMLGAGKIAGQDTKPYISPSIGLMEAFYVDMNYGFDSQMRFTFGFRPLKLLENLGVLKPSVFGSSP